MGIAPRHSDRFDRLGRPLEGGFKSLQRSTQKKTLASKRTHGAKEDSDEKRSSWSGSFGESPGGGSSLQMSFPNNNKKKPGVQAGLNDSSLLVKQIWIPKNIIEERRLASWRSLAGETQVAPQRQGAPVLRIARLASGTLLASFFRLRILRFYGSGMGGEGGSGIHFAGGPGSPSPPPSSLHTLPHLPAPPPPGNRPSTGGPGSLSGRGGTRRPAGGRRSGTLPPPPPAAPSAPSGEG